MTILDKLDEYLNEPIAESEDDLIEMMTHLINSLNPDDLTNKQVAMRNDIIAELSAKTLN